MPDLLHGALGHVPFVTMALSTTREIRLYHDRKTTLDRSIRNVTIDTVSVATGLTAGEIAAHFIGGAHSGFVSVPFTIAGSLIARRLLKGIKQRPYKEALARYEEVESAYSGKALEIATDLSAAAYGAVAQQRSPYLARVGLPPGIEQAAAAELAALTAGLRTATAGYLSSVQAVLDAATQQSANPAADDPSRSVLADDLSESMRNCDTQLQSGRYAGALLTLTRSTLPAPETWRPGREYRALCATTATRIAELADRNREDVARWATEAAAEFRERHEEIGVLVSAKAQTATQECAAAETALKEAAEAVEREAQALGFKRSET